MSIFEPLVENLVQFSTLALWASLVFLVGIIISKSIKKIIVTFLKKIRINEVLKRIGLHQALSRADIDFDAPNFFGQTVEWFVVLFFLMTSAGIVGMNQASNFLEKMLSYFPNLFIAILIFIVCAFLADFSQKIVVGTLEREKITYSKLLGRAIRWGIWLFAILAILYQLQITPSLILSIFIGIVATISITLGLAFGLGGKNLATKILEEIEEKFK